eukprot:gnl/MRDRNA2_/MRDRNA2_142318_c0_seq1.p1 gnl/MRDRNA2_/MRDRNA2_142318_c0~~gnl/MRDRNA2_/MRDRNA2_142318_c0_seq1.p1  ORF type:complete len:358 (+),score=47.77 gnl/MRDRNA2_/MRDRNA2_142318_c0_seq1:85-1158(+)
MGGDSDGPELKVLRFERFTSFAGNVLQTICALVFASYFLFGMIAATIWFLLSPWVLNFCSWKALVGFSIVYTIQLVLYKPHLNCGWPFHWFLYSKFTDCVLHYYDSTCIREGPPLDPNGKYMFAMFPHGVYGVCRIFSGGSKLWRVLYPGISARWGSFGAAFWMPGIREFSLCCGCLDASKPIMQKAVNRGENIILLPGGIDEMSLTDGKSTATKIVIKDRKGFTKISIENGMDIVPGFCFGEKWVHGTVQLPPVIRSFLRPFRLSGTLVRGRGLTFLGFLGVPLGYVWGERISVKQQKPVEDEYLNEVHEQVMQAISGIFERHKSRFGYGPEEKLEMVTAVEAKASLKSEAKSKAA